MTDLRCAKANVWDSKSNRANVLYGLTGSIILHCFHRGILVSVENPANSWFWLVSGMAKTNHLPLLSTNLHHCMFGASRKKHTKLLHTMPQMTLLGVLCDGKHEHQPSGAWATASECAYPPKMCASMAHAFVTQLLSLGAIPSATSLALDHLALARAAQVASGKQPKGKRVKPLVPAFASYVTLRGPAESMPPAGKLSASFAMSAGLLLMRLPTLQFCGESRIGPRRGRVGHLSPWAVAVCPPARAAFLGYQPGFMVCNRYGTAFALLTLQLSQIAFSSDVIWLPGLSNLCPTLSACAYFGPL